MRTSVAGSPKPHALRQAPAAQGGFTLLELMVVVFIMAMASAAVVLRMRDSQSVDLERDAQRLAAILESARAQSRMQGTPVYWRGTDAGFVLEGISPPQTEQTWQSKDTVLADVLPHAQAADAPARRVRLGPEPLLDPQSIVIASRQSPGQQVRVATDGVRPFAIAATMATGAPTLGAAP